jgi:chromosome segregation ATPase
LRAQAESAAERRIQKEHELNSAIEELKLAEQLDLKRIAEAEQRVVQYEDACRRLHIESQQRSERVQWLNEEIEGLHRAEAEQRKVIEHTEARLLAQLEAKHLAETEAQRKSREFAAHEQALNDKLAALRADESTQHERLAALNAQLAELQAAYAGVQTQVTALTNNEAQLQASVEQLHARERTVRASIAETEERLRAAEQAHLAAKIEAELRLEHEDQRLADLNSLRSDFAVTSQRRAEQVAALEAEIQKLREQESEQTTVWPNRSETARYSSKPPKRRKLRGHRQRPNFTRVANRWPPVNARIEELRQAEADTRKQIEEANAALQAHEASHQQAETEAREIFSDTRAATRRIAGRGQTDR